MKMPKIELHNMDCMEYMKGLEDNAFELAIVDPPYRDKNQPQKEMREKGSMETLEGRPDSFYFKELNRVSKNQIIWGVNNFNIGAYMGFVIWDKQITGVRGRYSDCEIASLSNEISTTSSIFRFSVQNIPEKKIHPTQKPVKLYEWLLANYAKEGDKILDTHLGSGSSAIAAHYGGFDFVGCELDEDYYKSASVRFERETAQKSLF